VDFGTYLQQAIDRAGMSRRAFALKVKYHPANMDQIVHGIRVPPLKYILDWGKILNNYVDLEHFQELAMLEHCPALIQKKYREMKGKCKGE